MKANELMIFRLFICAVALVPAATSVQQDCCTVEHVETVEEDKVGLQWRSTVDKATFMVEGKNLGASEWKELVWFKGPRGAASEIQVVQTRADEGQLITSGAFKLSLHMDNLHDMNSETASQTEWIPYDATAEQLKASLESLDHIDSVQVNRSPVDPQGGFSWSVTFPSPSNALDPSSKSPLTGRNIPTLMVSANTLDANFLSDRDKSVVVLTARDGGESVVNCGASGLCEGTVKGLEPNTGYQFRVRALVNDVLVPYSRDTGLVFTTSPRKRAAPQPFRVLDVSDEHVLFTVPSDSSDFDREKVQVSKSGSNQWTTLLPVQQGLDGNSQDTYYQALGLEPLTEYALRMPHTVQQGNWHATTFKTAAPKKQELELHVDSVEERNARLSWSIKNANCTRFELQTRKLLYGPSSGEEQDGDSRLWVDAVVANPKDLERSQVGVPEVQVIQTRADAGQRIQGGSFRLSFGKTMTKTERLPFDVSESHLKDELESIGVFASKVVRKGPNSENGFSWTILFDLSKHPGNQVQITVAEETLSSQSGATWSAPGSMVSISTVRDGSSSDSFPVSDNLEAEVLHLQPYRWYSFRVREVSADSISMWSAPTKPVRTKFDPFQHEEEQHAVVDSKEFEIVPGSNETAAKTLDPYYLTSVGNGGTSHFPRGGDGLIVFILSSSFSAMARSKARPIFFQFTGKSETFIVPNDPLIDQIEVRAWGAGGATGMLSGNSSHGGGGAYVRATIHLLDADAFRTRGEKRRMKSLQVRVGGGGQPGRGSLGGDGGFGGGGQGGYGSLLGGGGGGGASVVLSEHGDVLVVAGGGGGGGAADYCCAHGGAAGSSTGFSGLSPSGNELIGLDRSNPLDDAFAEHENIELGFAGAGADFSVLSQGGGGAMPFQGGPAGMSGSYYSFQGHSRVHASGGRSMVGGRGGSGHNAGGGGGGGFYGGGGGGSGLDGGGGGGGSSFVDSQYLLSFTKMEDPTAAFDHFDPPVLFAAQVEPGHVKIRWEKQHGAAYSIDVAVGPLSHHFHTIHNVGREEEAWFIDTAVAPGTTYQYRARAVSLKGGEEFVGPTIVVTTPESHTNVWNPIFPAPPLKEALRYEKQLEKITSSRQALEEHLAASRAFTSEDRLSASVAEEAGPWAASSRATLTSWRPTSRYGSTGVVLGDYLYLYGGMVDGDSCDTGGGSGPAHVDVGSDDASSRCFSSRQVRDDVWRFDSELGLWEEIARRTGAEAPRGRMFHSAVALGGKMVVFGGQGVEQVATDQVVGNDCSGIQTQTESGSSRMTSFSICDEESKSPIEKEWQLTPLDDLWELDPGQPLQVKISSLAEWETGAGDAVFSEAKDVSFSLENATSTETGFCISDVLQVALRLKHPCPFKLQVSLMGPGSKARNREGDLGTVLMMPYQSARQFCLDESNDELLHTVTLSDSAAADLSSYVFESGTFQPVTPLHRYLGMRVDSSDVWKLRVVDQDGNLLGSSNGTLVSWELSMHVLPCGLEPSWKRVQVHSPVAPGPRYGHGSLAVGGESLFVFGGKSLDRGLLKDLWRFDVATGEWHELFLEQEYVRGFESGVVPAHPLVGLLKISSSLSIVETYDFREHLWNTFPVNVASGITTTTSRHDVALAFDERRNRVLLFGGRTAAGVPLNELLSLDLRNVTGYELEHSLCYGFEKTCTLANSTVCLNLARLFLESLCAASTVA